MTFDFINGCRQHLFLVSHSEHGVRQPVAERIIVLELLEMLGVVGDERGDDPLGRPGLEP